MRSTTTTSSGAVLLSSFSPSCSCSAEKIEMKPGDSIHVLPKTVHRMTAIEDCDVLEASTPELDDVVRLEDRYGREGT